MIIKFTSKHYLITARPMLKTLVIHYTSATSSRNEINTTIETQDYTYIKVYG